ncbi:hypothetical protein OUZ56_021659 [Daphnia magna]|uniref:Nuclease HARBI1 n=1 Tax=Daphnia magna TaxID=35525 RepID=A0ABR0AU58_9CRUS|nr:hypothetical protein OUZ56_021659 [Daphnia magna]
MADHTDVIDEFLEDLDNLTDNVDDSSTESANSERDDERSARKRLIPFYQTRKDVLSYFSAENTGNRHFTKTRDSSKENLLPLDMVLIALQFYATGTFQTLKREYAEIARIPGIIGSIDGTHIRIQRPILHEKAYVM